MSNELKTWLEDRLNNIFDFLNANRQYNHLLQERFYKSVITPQSTSKDKVISLLYHIANTQSQPKIDKLADFYKRMIADKNSFVSFADFIYKINSSKQIDISFNSLFNGMQGQTGWGKKTAALFTKSIYHVHNGHYSEQLRIWDDVPAKIASEDNFYLPVDAVIITVFKTLDDATNWNFDKINSTLRNSYNGPQIEVWDDLWFWGFITQNGSGDKRSLKWNENKYWILKETDKDPEVIKEIKNKAENFLRIITNDELNRKK